jgi:uncharacterized protein
MLKSYIRKLVYLFTAIGFCSVIAGPNDAFFQAVATDNASAISTLFLRGADPNVRDDRGQLALVLALRDGQFRAADQLLSHPDLKVDLTNTAGETALMMAALKGRVDWMRRLLARGAAVDRAGWSPLHYAAAGPGTAAVQLLLEQGAALDARSPNGTTPLMMAARYGSEDAARLLLARGADPRLKNELELDAAAFARQAAREPLAAALQQAAAR